MHIQPIFQDKLVGIVFRKETTPTLNLSERLVEDMVH